MVQQEAPFWLLLLLLVPSLMVPSFVLDAWRKRFYPEFRDLAIEAEFFGLPLAPLEKWEVPLALTLTRTQTRTLTLTLTLTMTLTLSFGEGGDLFRHESEANPNPDPNEASCSA